MSNVTRRSFVTGGAAVLAAALAACTAERTDYYYGSAGGGAGALIGVSMPTKNLERWSRDGANLKTLLEDLGYQVELQFADNKVEQQNSQIQTMVNKSPAVIVVGSIDGSALGPVLATAARAGIQVVAYDRLIRDTEDVDYYVTFDNYNVGRMQGEYIATVLDLDNAAGPFNFEPFSGSPDDNNARFFFEGAWDVLKPYVDAGMLVCPSGKMPASVDDWQSIGIQAWSNTTAQAEMDNRLNSFYSTTTRVDAVLCPNDAIALGVTQALDSAGYTDADWPVLTGQDADQANVENIVKGRQSMTVFKDTRLLGERAATMVDQIVKGQEVEVNDTESYGNGVMTVPAYLIDPVTVDADSVQTVLVDSGYYTADEVGL
ncbi:MULTISPECIES: multiple monosaccharide ABC transporter substrate-binding protein [unclassified Actinomyces]|uniref:multiple monosaccharide ABC transporter substrate-binding protein n=1 Tax=unclassified Actinomyces TaxID=2609248 RepID=UPI0020182A35|nr:MULTISPECIES: multiple monosaccharide ABC transporter substrate-binding protein [unclassified Actinomyces]MCL3777172.1 sugar-binding protein [Actinomyces sp. AC-20-1]MCL3789004.1 sugar-binding protein [Actinomyces sp. 187325]MCL3791359.1 sugar-binding protein [Actinomyces sp. 186855]MCL3793930.1 sugar-binding protein [Actinomyces sp. 217892]